MAERHPQEDEVVRYVLGQLSSSEQHDFERQLAQSAELRALVQEMEEGAEALAHTVPQRPPPAQTWAAIEQAITQEARQKIVTPARWSNWWRNGWAAAAACLLGWFGYAVLSHHGGDRSHVPTQAALGDGPAAGINPTENSHPAALPASTPGKATVVPAPITNLELNGLRRHLATLQFQMQQLTQTVARQQAILTEPGRFKFFSLASNASGSSATNGAPLSPALQRALLYAMARELGWLPTTAAAPGADGSPAPAATNHLGVDFVDLIPPTNNSPATADLQPLEGETQDTTYSGPASVGSSGNIPGFVATNLVLVFDGTVVPSGSALSFWIHAASQGEQWIGSTVTGEYPTVVTIPTSTTPGWTVTVTASAGNGASNVIGQFFSP